MCDARETFFKGIQMADWTTGSGNLFHWFRVGRKAFLYISLGLNWNMASNVLSESSWH